MFDPGQMNVPDVAGAVGGGSQLKFLAGMCVGRIIKQHQPYAGSIAAEDGKVGASGIDGCAKGSGVTGR